MTFDEWVSDEFGKAIEFDPSTGKSQTSGEIWKKIAKEKLGGYTLVDGKNTYEVIDEDPKNKHDINLMLACCKAECENANLGWTPAPYYFERAAILFSKAKMYDQEIKILNLYIEAWKKVNPSKAQITGRGGSFYERIKKAEVKIEKARAKAEKTKLKGG